MKTRVALLFVVLSLLATSVHATDFKKGVGSGWFLNVHNWTQPWGTAAKPGKRFFEDTVADIRRLKKAKFDHMRLHFHIDGLLFWSTEIQFLIDSGESDTPTSSTDSLHCVRHARAPSFRV